MTYLKLGDGENIKKIGEGPARNEGTKVHFWQNLNLAKIYSLSMRNLKIYLVFLKNLT